MYTKVQFPIHVEEEVRFELTDHYDLQFSRLVQSASLPFFLLCRRRDSNPQSQRHQIYSLAQISYSARRQVWIQLESNQCGRLFRPVLYHLSYESKKKNPGV